ncbi:hypothetical protein D3C78_19630 [compost metagenome]
MLNNEKLLSSVLEVMKSHSTEVSAERLIQEASRPDAVGCTTFEDELTTLRSAKEQLSNAELAEFIERFRSSDNKDSIFAAWIVAKPKIDYTNIDKTSVEFFTESAPYRHYLTYLIKKLDVHINVS